MSRSKRNNKKLRDLLHLTNRSGIKPQKPKEVKNSKPAVVRVSLNIEEIKFHPEFIEFVAINTPLEFSRARYASTRRLGGGDIPVVNWWRESDSSRKGTKAIFYKENPVTHKPQIDCTPETEPAAIQLSEFWKKHTGIKVTIKVYPVLVY